MWPWSKKNSYRHVPESNVSNPDNVLQAIKSVKADRSLKDFVDDRVLDVINRAASESNLVPIQELDMLGSVVAAIAPQKSFEVGLASGSTALTIMAAGLTNQHIAIDPYQANSYGSQGIRRIGEAGFSSRFRWIEQYSYVAMPALLEHHAATFDFVYIDGNHMFDHTMLEWFYTDKFLKIGGVVGFDDCHWAMVKTVVNFLETNTSYKFVRMTDRTFFAVKMSEDVRKWYSFKPFDVVFDAEYLQMIEMVRLDEEKAVKQ